jgi:gluconolactonase
MKLELIAEGFQFPEGPVAMADGSILVTEIKRRTITRIAPDGRCEIVARLEGGPNGAAIGPDGALYITNNGGSYEWLDHDGLTIPGPRPAGHRGGSIQRLDLHSGVVTTLYEACGGERLISPNDLVFDKSGGFWFTDNGAGTESRRDFGRLHYAKTDGSMIVAASAHLFSPNGVGLSPDEKVVYVADTLLGRLWAFDVVAPGVTRAVSQFQPARVVANLPGVQFLDSLAVEAGGRVCVATILNGGVTVFDPTDGTTEHVPVPDLICTNICFGGADMQDAWITASATGKLFKTRWPRAGLKLNFNA